MIKEFDLKNTPNLKLSDHFSLREFVCKDGTTKILLDTDLIDKLEKIRNMINCPILILSGYRTESYNKSIGGATNSFHCQGMACDIYCKSTDKIIQEKYSKMLAIYAVVNGLGGIGFYTERTTEPYSFVHIDTRENKYLFEVINGKQKKLDNMCEIL